MTAVLLAPMDSDDVAAWADEFGSWHTDLRAKFGLPPEARFLQRAVHDRAADAPVFAVTAEDVRVGSLAIRVVQDNAGLTAVIDDLTISPEYRWRGYGTQALALAREWADGRAILLSATVYAEDPAATALYREIPARAQHMAKPLEREPLPDGHGLLPATQTVRPLRPEEFADWKAASVEGYASDVAGSGLLSIDEARAAAMAQTDQILPEGLATPGHTIEVVELGGATAGYVWLKHGYPDDGVSFVYMVQIEPAMRGRGLGKAAMVAAERTSLAHGSKAIMLNVFAQNDVAISLYRRLGYGVLAQYRSVELEAA